MALLLLVVGRKIRSGASGWWNTQTITGLESNGDAEPGAAYVIPIWHCEITKH